MSTIIPYGFDGSTSWFPTLLFAVFVGSPLAVCPGVIVIVSNGTVAVNSEKRFSRIVKIRPLLPTFTGP